MKKIFKYFLLPVIIVIVLIGVNFIVTKKLDQQVLEMENFNVVKKNENTPCFIPSKFIDGERFYIKVPVENNDSLLAFGDSGGGLSMIIPSTIEKKNLQSKVHYGLMKGILPAKYMLFKDLISDARFPQLYPYRGHIIRHPFSRVTEPFFFVPSMDNEMKFFSAAMPDMNVFLGQNFFMGKSWTIDYVQQKIWVNTPLTANDKSNPNVLKIGFKKNSHHENIFGHASMYMVVNGDTNDVLFDTGATFVLSDNGKKELNTTQKTIGGSFIAASIFDKWRKEHPEWKYYPKADMNSDVIEVPIVKIGNNEVGPVLFSKRPDENWSQGMINTMDKIVKGAIGGSALKYLKVTIDYNAELIKFEK